MELDLGASTDAILIGEEPFDGSFGVSVAGAGDVDGDGTSDLLLGFPGQVGGETRAGAAYLVRGPVTGRLDLADATAKLSGSANDYSGDFAGSAVASAGDLNRDGHDDLLVGAPGGYGSDNVAGRVYVVYGPVAGESSLLDADATIFGESSAESELGDSKTGATLANAGDVNGDGVPDILVGAYCYGLCSGAAYLFLGPLIGDYQVADAEMRLYGSSIGWEGYHLASAGDTNGDGLDDFLISDGTSAVLLFTGPASGLLEPADADAALRGDDTIQPAGALASAGDVDGDGYADLLIGDPNDDAGGRGAGAVYAMRGPFSGDVQVASADTKLVGAAERDLVGSAVATGDFNGDSTPDILAGAPGYDAGGSSYVVFGPTWGTFSLADADVVLNGDGDDESGSSLASVGDIDGDGCDDLLVAGAGDDEGGEMAGAAWLVLGASLR